MTNRFLVVVLLLLLVSQWLNAQKKVNGRIYSASTDSVISAATIYNKALKQTVYSGKDGSYNIPAAEGDTLIFTAIGFAADTIMVQFYMLLVPYDVTLPQKILTLKGVQVKSSYSQDSSERRNYYANLFKKQPGITGFNRPNDGVGIVLSPVSYLSKDAKAKRALKKRILKQEQEDYIDRSFPAEWVERLTQLKGDSLSLFLYGYRPSYSFCRKTDRQGMLIYINDKLKELRKPK